MGIELLFSYRHSYNTSRFLSDHCVPTNYTTLNENTDMYCTYNIFVTMLTKFVSILHCYASIFATLKSLYTQQTFLVVQILFVVKN